MAVGQRLRLAGFAPILAAGAIVAVGATGPAAVVGAVALAAAYAVAVWGRDRAWYWGALGAAAATAALVSTLPARGAALSPVALLTLVAFAPLGQPAVFALWPMAVALFGRQWLSSGPPVDLSAALPAAAIALLAWLLALAVYEGDRDRRALADARAQMIRAVAEARHQGERDALTGLGNRTALERDLERALAGRQAVAIVALDVDRFAMVNDTLGHPMGDRVLGHLARRLVAAVREGDRVYRQGGDEFFVLLDQVGDKRQAAALVYAMQRALSQPVELAEPDLVLPITVSAGAAMAPQDAHTAPELIARADAALRRAKLAGRNCYRFYYDAMAARMETYMRIQESLRQVMATSQLSVHYQPQVDIATGEVYGAEALVRWHHPTLGDIPPSEFVPVAEELGVMEEIGDWVLETACREIKSLPVKTPLRLSVNLSASQLVRPDASDRILAILRATGFDPGRLVLEVAESLTMHSVPRVAAKLGSLRAAGIGLSVDDFGTGYASLSYLQAFPITSLKMDRSFVSNILNSPVIPSGILDLANHLGLYVVTEGVETSAEASALQSLGGRLVQGFLYAKPMPLDAFREWLASPGQDARRAHPTDWSPV